MTTSDFWNDLAFAYLTIYSYNRGESERVDDWPSLLINAKGEWNATAVAGRRFSHDAPEVSALAQIFRLPLINRTLWMCAPVYRDGICFFGEEGRLLSRVDLCMSCWYLKIEGSEVEADDQFFLQLADFFRRIGHEDGDRWVERGAEERRERRGKEEKSWFTAHSRAYYSRSESPSKTEEQ